MFTSWVWDFRLQYCQMFIGMYMVVFRNLLNVEEYFLLNLQKMYWFSHVVVKSKIKARAEIKSKI